jgi:hypothetical protein
MFGRSVTKYALDGFKSRTPRFPKRPGFQGIRFPWPGRADSPAFSRSSALSAFGGRRKHSRSTSHLATQVLRSSAHPSRWSSEGPRGLLHQHLLAKQTWNARLGPGKSLPVWGCGSGCLPPLCQSPRSKRRGEGPGFRSNPRYAGYFASEAGREGGWATPPAEFCYFWPNTKAEPSARVNVRGRSPPLPKTRDSTL